MDLLDFIFKRNTYDKEKNEIELKKEDGSLSDDYVALEPYIEVTDKQELIRISIIASSIMSGNETDKKFIVKKISRRNPEVKLLSVISASVLSATNLNSDTTFKLKSIKKRKGC